MVKQFGKQMTALLLVLILTVTFIPFTALAANTSATIDGVTISYDNSKFSYSNGTFTITPSSSSGCTGTTYSIKSGDITINKGSGHSSEFLKCHYSASVAKNGSLSIGGVATTEANGDILLNKSETTKNITLKSGDAENANSTITLSDFEYYDPDEVFGVYVFGGAHGTITVEDTEIAEGEDGEFEASYNSPLHVSVTPDSGYTFIGLIDQDSNVKLSLDDGLLRPTYEVNVEPIFAKTDVDPVFSVGTMLFTDFNAAASESAVSSKPMIPVQDCSLPAGNYTVPNKATLLIPFDEGGTLYTDTPYVIYNSYTTPTAFRTMKMEANAKITVQSGGAISVGSQLSSKGQLGGTNGCPTGPDGRIEMRTGSKITLNSGSNLYAWGYVYGSGDIEAISGSTVYEAFQIKDWRGGTATSNVYDYAFIFNQYYIQNIEVPLKIHSGASEKLYSSVNASSSPYPVSVDFVGKTSGMFRLTDGYMLKDYIEAKDQVAYQINGTATIAPLVISGVPMLGSVTTADYILPFNGGMVIDIQSGTTTINQDLELLPGTTVSVQQNATVVINSNKKVYLYDKEDWGNFTGSAKMYAVGYSVANGTAAVRTVGNLTDARIDVNGTFDVKGSLYTSSNGADITSTIGTQGEHGKLVFSTAPPSDFTTIYECEDNSKQTGVFMYPPLVHNGDDTHSATAGTGQSTWKYDKLGEHWYRWLVNFNFNGNLIDRRYYCENNDTVTYDASWLENLGATASNGTPTVNESTVSVTGVTADSVVTLTGTPKEYIPTFVLNEKQYSIYRLYTGNTISDTATIGDETYYIVKQAASPLPVATAFEQPSDASMGVIPANQNTITWNMSGLSATSGDPYLGIVPAGETAQEPVYIYGFYTGKVAHNKTTNTYYSTLIDAFADLNPDDTAEIELLADCGTFEDELGTQAYSIYPYNDITLDLNGHHAVGRIINQGNFTLELDGGTFDFETGATEAAAKYNGTAAVLNEGVMTVNDAVGGGKITADGIAKDSGFANYNDVIRNNTGASLTVSDVTLQHKQSVNSYSLALLNYGTAVVDNVTITPVRGVGIGNSGASSDLKLRNTNLSFTGSAYYGVYNTSSGKISEIINCNLSTPNVNVIYNTSSSTIALIDNCNLSTKNVNVIYNTDSAKITSLKNTDITVTTPTTANVYAVFNYGGTITTMDHCTVTGNSGINNRNKRGSNTIAQGYNIAHYGTIGTIKDTTVNVGMYAVYNGGTINTMTGSTFTASPASAQVPWATGTAALNGNKVHCYTVVNSNTWWYDSAVWKRTDTTVKNGDTTMLQRRIDEYKTEDTYMPTIGTITDCTITANNTSTSNSYGYFALQNLGVINTITGDTSITAKKHDNNATAKIYGYYAMRNEAGGKIGSIASTVSINAYNYALANIGARYSQTDTTYSTTYMASGALASGKLATDYDYTYANVSTIGSTAATISATSQYAILNYSKIGSVTGAVSGNYNVIVNAGAANTTTGIEGTTANSRAIEHRYFTGNDSSTTDNEYRRYFEYERNTTDGCYIGEINATVTATGAGYQAISNQGYIGTLAGTVSTPTGKATSSGTYYPLIFNGNARQATLKQTEDYYTETNGAGATKYDREYTYEIPTIDTISCTATNPQDYTLQNYGQINNLTGSISGKTITVANEAGGPYLTRKTRMFYSSASAFAASKASSEVNLEYTKQPAGITNINGATITATGGTYALRNYGYVDEIKDSTITSTSTYTVGNAGSTITEYTSNRADVLTGCVPDGTSSCALNYDISQTINENEERSVGTINKIGAGNYITGTYHVIYNLGRINTMDSGTGKTSIIYGSSRQAIYNLQGDYDRRTNTDAAITAATGTTTNNYTYNYVPAYIGTIKNIHILGKRQAILNGDGNATYKPVTIGEIGEGAEIRTTATATYSACHNLATNAKIEKITGGVFMTGNGSGIYGLNNASTTYPIEITGGDFRGGDGTRALAIYQPDAATRYTYPAGASLSTTTETATYHTLSNKVLTAKTNSFYYIPDTFTVTFDKQGHGEDIDVQYIQKGGKATQPDAPADGDIVTEGGAKFRFDGWYTDDTFATAFDFNTAITADTTVYAKWTEVYTVTFNDENGTALQTGLVDKGDTPSCDAPTKESTAQFNYTFAGWRSSAYDTVYTTLPAATADVTYTATYNSETRGYTVVWKNGDTVLETDENVLYHTLPNYNGAEPTKESTAQYSYTFSGWTPTISPVTGDATYTAVFTETTRTYTITWKNDDGSVIDTTKVEYGAVPTHADATKAPTAQYSYTFAGWDTAPAAVTGDATYTATYTSTVNKYNITWKNYDGSTIKTEEVEYGTTPNYTGETPTKPADEDYTYNFTGWSPAITSVTGAAEYTAQFEARPLTTYHTVKWTVVEGDAPTEEDIKATVDAVIEKHAAEIYNAAKDEMGEDWQYMPHDMGIQMILHWLYGISSSNGGDSPVSTYITNKILYLIDNDASANSSAESQWSNIKDDIVADLLGSSIVDATDTAELNALSGPSATTLETDSSVPYGTVPTFNSETPTKEGDAQYSYTFAGWSTDGENVIDPLTGITGDTTYIAVFTQTLNTYAVNWKSVVPAASEADTKTAVDALIAETAQKIYSDARTEGEMMWDLGWMSHEELVKMHLDAGHVGSTASSAYIAKRIIEIVENGSADFTAADALWDSCKDTIAADFAAFRGYSSSEGDTTYSGLTEEQKSSMEALAGGETTIETDASVPYGTVPSFNGTTPTKQGYVFAGWGLDGTTVIDPLPAVTGDVTYIAAFAEAPAAKHSLTLEGEIGVNFYIPTVLVEDAENSTFEIYWGPDSGVDHGEVKAAIKELTNADKVWYHVSDGGLNTQNPIVKAKINGDYYQITAYVAAKQMADDITLNIYDGEKTLVLTDVYHVSDYCNEVIENKDGKAYEKIHTANSSITEEKFEDLQELCKAMLTYGSSAQTQFNYNTGDPADAGLDYTYDHAVAGDFEKYSAADYLSNIGAMSYYGSSMLLEAETTYTLWFRYEDSGYEPPEMTAFINDKELVAEKMKVEGNYDAYYVRYNILNLPANMISKDITVSVGGDEMTFNAQTYFYYALSSGNATLNETVASLYNYNQNAVMYFG